MMNHLIEFISTLYIDAYEVTAVAYKSCVDTGRAVTSEVRGRDIRIMAMIIILSSESYRGRYLIAVGSVNVTTEAEWKR